MAHMGRFNALMKTFYQAIRGTMVRSGANPLNSKGWQELSEQTGSKLWDENPVDENARMTLALQINKNN